MKKIVLYCLLAALLLSGCAEDAPIETQPETTEATQTTETTVPETTEAIDYSAPDFTMVDSEGREYKLSDFEGKPVVLNFWASWCGPCKSEMPDLEEAYREYGDEIHFLIVNLTDGTTETVESASAYIESQSYTFPVYYDTGMLGAYAYGVSAIPVTFFIDANGDLVTYYEGMMSAEILEKGIGFIYGVEETE